MARGKLVQLRKLWWGLINETIDEFSKDRGDLVAAALAFNTLLSLAPIIIIAVGMAGLVLGHGAAHQEVLTLLLATMGKDAAAAVDGWVLEASRTGGVASAIGIVLTIVAASRFTWQLRTALNQVLDVDVLLAKDIKSSMKSYIGRQAFALAMVVASGPVLLAVFMSRALLTGFGSRLLVGSALTGFFAHTLQLVFSLLLVAALSALVFRFIPDTHLAWRAVLSGAVLTSLLFNVGNLLVGLYLGKASVGATYGAAGSVVVVLLWLYFSAQMFLYGAEFTKVYAKRHDAAHRDAAADLPSEATDHNATDHNAACAGSTCSDSQRSTSLRRTSPNN